MPKLWEQKTELITPKTIKAMYDLFRKLPPFDNYVMPLPSRIEWVVVHDTELYGMYQPTHIITISTGKCMHFDTVARTLLHEMVHMFLYLKGKPKYDQHDETFRKLTYKIAKIYGYDPKEI